jgi:hypothetical protein
MNTLALLVLIRDSVVSDPMVVGVPLTYERLLQLDSDRALLAQVQAERPHVEDLRIQTDATVRDTPNKTEIRRFPIAAAVDGMLKVPSPPPELAEDYASLDELRWRYHDKAWLRLGARGFTLDLKAQANPGARSLASPLYCYSILDRAALALAPDAEVAARFRALARTSAPDAARVLRGDLTVPGRSAEAIRAHLTPECLVGLLESEHADVREVAMTQLPSIGTPRRTGRSRR